MIHSLRRFSFAILLAAAVGCGDGGGSEGGGGGGGDGGAGGGADANPDITPGCETNPACSNCVDDDGDGLIDGADPECTGGTDDREDSFETGIPGDNVDPGLQDCFFDGNSGAGDDGCLFHTCCLLEDCPAEFNTPPFDPMTDCEVSMECVDFCEPLTPAGCDCFGCCTICDDEGCLDVVTGAPDCDSSTDIRDPEKCPVCTPNQDCYPGGCSDTECILCPGQIETDLPDYCDGNVCPDGRTVCTTAMDCAGDEFCSNGCCIGTIQ